MRRVIIESPWQGGTSEARVYLRRCIYDCIMRGETPYASHRMLTDALSDVDPKTREIGLNAGLEWRQASHATVVYEDYGHTAGMRIGIAHAESQHGPIEYRKIGQNPHVGLEEQPRRALEGLLSEFEAVIRQADAPKGGQQVGPSSAGDFAGAVRMPSMLSSMRWWIRELREAREALNKRDEERR